MRLPITITLITALIFVADFANANDANATVSIDEVVVTATRRAVKADDVSSPISTIGRDDVLQQKLVTDALAASPGVFLQQTTPGQGAAIVRGLKGSAVLHMVDGIRLNNAIFRSAPTQYLALVPTSAVDRIEVIRGTPASLYGSDAVGGVVQLVSRVPAFEQETNAMRGDVLIAYDTADLGKSIRATVDAGNRKLAGSMSLEYLETDDRQVGGGERVGPSGYDSTAARLVLSATPQEDRAWLLDVHWLEQDDTPRVDELVPGYGQAEPSSSEYSFRPNERIFVHGRHRRDDAWLGMDWNVDLAWQRITDDRVSRPYQSNVRRFEENGSDMAAAIVSASRTSNEGSWVAGFEYYDDSVSSSRRETDIQNGQGQMVAARFPDGSSVRQASLFANLDRRLNERNAVNGGLRFSAVSVSLPATSLSPDVEIDVENLSGDLGWVFDVSDNWQFVTNLGAGFRAPNVFDLGTLGERPGNRFNIPNTDLGAEHVVQLDAGVRRISDRLQFEFVVYGMRYRDRITSVATGNFTPDGREIVQSTNAAEADLRGFETGLNAALTDALSVNAVMNYTWGTQRFDDGTSEPGDRIPPLSGSLELSYVRSVGGVDAWVRYAGLQDRLSARDVGDVRINPTGTAGWGIVGVSAYWMGDDTWTVTLGMDNLLDKSYRLHGSGLDAPGRSVFASVQVGW